MARISAPFGPQHPVLPEPLQLNITYEDEKVVNVAPAIGYIHRGIEKAGELNDYPQNVFLVERVCGICSFMHAMIYCEALEEIMKVEITPRAKYLRVFYSEISRAHSHLLWLGLLADAFGFESLFMKYWAIREKVVDLLGPRCQRQRCRNPFFKVLWLIYLKHVYRFGQSCCRFIQLFCIAGEFFYRAQLLFCRG